MSGASNTLAREFLTDVHQLCSAVAQRAEAREEDEEESHMVALGEYLVRGRGFLLLSTLDSIIDQVGQAEVVHPVSWGQITKYVWDNLCCGFALYESNFDDVQLGSPFFTSRRLERQMVSQINISWTTERVTTNLVISIHDWSQKGHCRTMKR